MQRYPYSNIETYGTPITILGSGAFGDVTDYGKYAIKSLDYECCLNSGIKEIVYIKSLCKLVNQSCEENIVPVLDVVFDKYSLKLIMPKGIVLSQYQTVDKRKIIYQLCRALYYIHSSGIIHNDIKPDNCLVINDQAVIADFGLAQDVLYYNLSDDVQTLNYKPPELLLGDRINLKHVTAADVWALGCTIYEWYTGRKLFNGTNEFNQIEEIFRIRGMPNDYPGLQDLPLYSDVNINQPGIWNQISNDLDDELLYDLISQMLTINPEHRPRTDMILNHPYFGYPGEIPLYLSHEQQLAHRDKIIRPVFSMEGRNKIIRWLIRSAEKLSYISDVHLAIRLFDNFYSCQDNKDHYLYALCCLIISVSLGTSDKMDLSEWSLLEYTDDDILYAITDICKVLDFDLNQVTCLKYIILFAPYYSEQVNDTAFKLSHFAYLNDLSFYYSNREMALGIILYCCELHNKRFVHKLTDNILNFKNEFALLIK